MATPSNVAVNFDDGVGATFFDLTILQVVLLANIPWFPRQCVDLLMQCKGIEAFTSAEGNTLPSLKAEEQYSG